MGFSQLPEPQTKSFLNNAFWAMLKGFRLFLYPFGGLEFRGLGFRVLGFEGFVIWGFGLRFRV